MPVSGLCRWHLVKCRQRKVTMDITGERRTYVRYLHSQGSFYLPRECCSFDAPTVDSNRLEAFCTLETEELVRSRDIRLLNVPESAFGCYFFDRYEITIIEEGCTLHKAWE